MSCKRLRQILICCAVFAAPAIVLSVLYAKDCEMERAKAVYCPDKKTFTHCKGYGKAIPCENRKEEKIHKGFFVCVDSRGENTECVEKMERVDGKLVPVLKVCWQETKCRFDPDKKTCVPDMDTVVFHYAYVHETVNCKPKVALQPKRP